MGWTAKKVEQPLELYLVHQEGTLDAMALWIDPTHVHVLSRQQHPLDEPLRAYLDVRPFSRQVELELVFKEVTRPPGGSTRSWIHRAVWKATESVDQDWLLEKLRALNPALGLERLGSSSVVRKRRSVSSRGSISGSADAPSRGSAPPSPQHPALYSPGSGSEPASLLVRLSDQRELVWSVRLDGEAMDLRLAMAGAPSPGQQLMLLLQLPGEAYIQASARVVRVRGGQVRLHVSELSNTDLALLHRAFK